MLCPTIAITFSIHTKINWFTLSHHESYGVNLLPITRMTSNINVVPHGGHETHCFVRLYKVQLSYQWDGRIEVCFWPRRRQIALFQSLDFLGRYSNSSPCAIQKILFGHVDFPVTRKQSRCSSGGIATTLSLWSAILFHRIPLNYFGFYHQLRLFLCLISPWRSRISFCLYEEIWDLLVQCEDYLLPQNSFSTYTV